jgi:hypothetical protein
MQNKININNNIDYFNSINNNNNEKKILFLIETCIFTFFLMYWLCLIRRCNSFWLFILLNLFLLSFIDLFF